MNYYLGFDPGINGALALVDEDGELHDACDLPKRVAGRRANGKDKLTIDEVQLSEILYAWNQGDPITSAAIERVQASPGAGAVSMFSFGEGYGKIQGVLTGLDIPCHLITPKDWKGSYGLGKEKRESLDLALQTWPHFHEEFKRVKDADRAEAALIALYHMRSQS